MMAWSRLAMTRSRSGISAIFPRTSLSPSGLPAFSSRTRSFIAPSSWSVNLADFFGSFTAGFLLAMLCALGRRHSGDLPLLENPDGVAEGVANAHVGAIEVVGGLLGEVGDAARLEGLVKTPDVVRVEHEPAQRALRDEFAELRSGGFVMH